MQHKIQGTPEWLEYRKRKIGASDAPIIMGVSPWSNVKQLYEQKTGPAVPFYENAAMARGKRLEGPARDLYQEMTGHYVIPMVVEHPQHDWMIASLDGMSIDRKAMVEIKTGSAKQHDEASRGIIPKHYYPQLQHQLACTGLLEMDFFHYDGETGYIVIVQRDDEYIKELIRREREFYECVITRTPPFSLEENEQQMESPEWMELVEEVRPIYLRKQELTRELNQVKKDETVIKERMLLMTDVTAHGGGISLVRSTCKAGLDEAAMIADGIDIEKYRKEPIVKWSLKETR